MSTSPTIPAREPRASSAISAPPSSASFRRAAIRSPATSRGHGTPARTSASSRPTIPNSTRCSRGRHRVRHAVCAPASTSSTRRACAGRRVGVASHRSGSTARAPTGARPTSASWPLAGTCSAPAIPIARPVRCTEPTGYAHTGPEAAFAALTALVVGRAAARRRLDARGRPRSRTWRRPARFPQTGFRGQRRGANIGRTREIWPTKDGFVSFGLRGGKARVAEPRADLRSSPALPRARLDATYNQNTATDEELREIETAVAEYFAQHTMQELYDIACETNLMLAPANSPREIYASAQLAARDFFGPVDDRRSRARSCASSRPTARPRPPAPNPRSSATRRSRQPLASPSRRTAARAWAGLQHPRVRLGCRRTDRDALLRRARRDRAAHRVASRGPTSCACYALGPDNPHGLEGAPMYDGLNVGKRNLTLNLKQPDAVALVRRLVVEWADAVAENFAPRAMKRLRPRLRRARRDHARPRDGERVPERADRSAQGLPRLRRAGLRARRATTCLTGWPDREPVGPFGTITDSLAPRFVADRARGRAALPAAHRPRRLPRRLAGRDGDLRRSRPGCSTTQVDGEIRAARRQRPSPSARCTARSRAPTRTTSATGGSRSRAGPTTSWTRLRRDRRATDVAAWTRDAARATRGRRAAAGRRHRSGAGRTTSAICTTIRSSRTVATSSRTSTRSSGRALRAQRLPPLGRAVSGYDRAGPTLGQDNDWVLTDVLGLDAAEIERLRANGAVEVA